MLKDITIKMNKKIAIDNFANEVLDFCNGYLEVNYDIDSPEQTILNYSDLLITVFGTITSKLP